MTNRQTPPGLTFISWVVVVNPLGPHQLETCLGSVHVANTSSRGASKMRVVTISRVAFDSLLSSLLADMGIPWLVVSLEAEFCAKYFGNQACMRPCNLANSSASRSKH